MRGSEGYILVPVVLMLAVVATVSYLVTFEGAQNTSSIARELEIREARYVAEAGYSEARWILEQNGTCTGYADLPATAFGAHSYSVTVTPESGSPVQLTSTGVLASGAKRVLRRTASAYQPAQVFVLQPGVEGQDVYLWDGAHKDKNFGVSPKLSIDNQGAERTSLLRFDLSSLPPGKVLAANLDLYLEGGAGIDNGVLNLHNMTRSWVEGVNDDATPTAAGATYMKYDGFGFFPKAWTTPGGDYDPTPAASLSVASLVPGFHQWDITGLVGAWVDGAANNGLLLRAPAGGSVDKVDFTSSDGSPASRRPRLTILYACDCGVACTPPGTTSPRIILSTDGDAQLGGLNFTDLDLVEFDASAQTASLFLEGAVTGSKESIDAVHVLANGHIVVSSKGTTTLGGLDFEDEDLVDYDPETDTATMLFDGSKRVVSGDGRVRSVHVRPDGLLVLSVAGDTLLGGIKFTKFDLVEYDPVTDTATLLLKGSDVGIGASIDAVHILDNGHVVLSFEGGTNFAGLNLGDGDLADYDPATANATLLFDGGALFAGGKENVLSAHVGPGSGAGRHYLDEFNAIAYDGNDGGLLFSNAWQEWGDDDKATGGDVRVVTCPSGLDSNCLEFRDGIANIGVSRTADLGFAPAATLRFDWRRGGAYQGNEFSVEVRKDGGTWLMLFEVPDGNETSVHSETLAIPIAYLSTNTELRFIAKKDGDGSLYVDDVRIDLNAEGVGGGPPGGSTCNGTFRDEFNERVYSGNDGTLEWSGDWQEINESDGPTQNDERVFADLYEDPPMPTYQLHVRDNDGGGEGVMRGVDLSGAKTATLSFDYKPYGLDDKDDYASVQMSASGTGGPWTEVMRYKGPLTSDAYMPFTTDISKFISADAVLRIITSPNMGTSDYLWLDNVEISCSP